MSAIFGERLIFGQQDGPDVELIVFGDEFYARYETADGYTVVYDLDLGKYCYATIHDGRFVSSRTPLSKPAPIGFRKHFKESVTVRNEKFDAQYRNLRPQVDLLSASSNVMRTFGPNSGLLEGRQVSIGNVRGLTILVEFDDLQTNVTQEDVEALLNHDNYKANGNFCSVKEYYSIMSNGRLNYTNKVVGPVRLSKWQSYYINHHLASEAMELAINQFNLDLSEFDSRGEGLVDAVNFMYAGRSLYQGLLWPHNHYKNLTFGNYSTHFYTIQSLGRNKVDLSIGTFAHESGHMLCRFPDLYDYGQRDGDFENSSGLGKYCLMSSGNHNGNGKRPSPICAYLRDLAGWCQNEVILNNPGVYEAKHGDYSTIWRYRTEKPNEYYIVENRHQNDLDLALPDSGLAIYHCDTRGSNEYQDGTPDEHYQCALLQADGHFDLENTVNGGDSYDLFDAAQGTALSDTTIPNSREWDGTDSGLLVSDIGPTGDNMQFRVGSQSDVSTITKTVVADLLIPDSDPGGITSETEVSETGKLLNIKLALQITHTYRGDLKIELESPSKKIVTLFSNQGGSLDNLNLQLDSADFAPLQSLLNEEIRGTWGLHVEDLLKKDVGRLDTWSLTLEYESQDQSSSGEASPGLVIPDYNVNGIESPIHISDSGKAKGISIDVDITHPYRGDLQIEIVAPSGQRAILRNSNGISGTDLVESYSDLSTSSLKTLIGENTEGDWLLVVRDLLRYDEGVLNRWALTLIREQ